MKQTLTKITTLAFSLYFFLLPLFVFPQISPFIDFAKRVLALFFLGVFLFLLSLKILSQNEIKLTFTPLSLLLLLFSFFLTLSSLFSPNKIDSLLNVSPLIISCLLFFIFQNLLNSQEELASVFPSLVVSGVFLSLFTLLQEINSRVNILSPLTQNAPLSLEQILLSKNFSFLGSLLAQIFYFLSLLPLPFYLFQKNKEEIARNLSLFSFLLILIGSLLTFKNLIFSSPVFLDYSSSWKIALQTLTGNFKEALLGVGPGNYTKSLNLYKSITYNNKNYWNTEFPQGHSEVLNLLTTSGLLGFLGFLSILFFFFLHFLKGKGLFRLPLLLFIPASFFFPIPISFWLFFLPFSALLLAQKEPAGYVLVTSEDSTLQKSSPRSFAAILFFLLSSFLSLLFFYVSLRLSLAEYYYNQSYHYTDATNVFTLQTKALNLYPFSEGYHITLSKTNLAIANALAQKKDLSDEERQIALNHIQLALDSARRAIALNPERKFNYENLADIYQSLSPSFKGAEDFALENYTSAISLAPLNPDLYIKRGGVFLSKNDLENALKDFSASVNLKPDFPNARYNLSFAYEKLGQYDKALEELKIILKLLPSQSPDLKKVQEDIKRLTDLKISSPSAKPLFNPQPALPKPSVPTATPTEILIPTTYPSATLTPSP